MIETKNVETKAELSSYGLAAGAHVMLAISDTGCGMDGETTSKVFEPFFTTKAVGKGTGLGLSTVYGIVKQSDGEIVVKSEVGEGTTFEILLPRQEADEDVEAAVEVVSSLEGSDTVLLVEDQSAVRDFAALALRRYGYEVLVAEDGEAALKLSEAHGGTIDVLVTDVVMPRTSGVELAVRLRSLRPGCKVVYISGYTGQAFPDRRRLDPAVPLLSKPFTAEELVGVVRRTLTLTGNGE